ncbi:MAG: ATP-dependent sacrificial sulfur transferase LarE [Thermodesulfovibrionales bacterium]|nr:ATP-dependent sacrificial sulfur transferase LarE [Thermodesulfovibrionales bacterium]
MSTYERLLSKIKGYNNSIIAYSGGVDSSLLLKLSKVAEIKVLPITVVSEVTIKRDVEDAKAFTSSIGINLHIEYITLLSNDNFRKNPRNRCFFCKEIMMKRLLSIAKEKGYEYILEGTNHDDLDDWRPGLEAIKKYPEVKSPFLEMSVKKMDIRGILKDLGMTIRNKHASPCLATRIHYDTEITQEIIDKVRQAEEILINKGFRDVRVRTDGNNAFLEVNPNQTSRLIDTALGNEIIDKMLSIGFKTVDIARDGYVSGRLNKT